MELDVNTKILYVEDDPMMRVLIKSMLNAKYMNVITANCGHDGFELFVKECPNIVITDIMMPDGNGITMMTKIREIDKNVPIIVASAIDRQFVKFNGLHVFGHLTKPISKFDLLIMVEDAILSIDKNKE